jgi:hypothetical protein
MGTSRTGIVEEVEVIKMVGTVVEDQAGATSGGIAMEAITTAVWAEAATRTATAVSGIGATIGTEEAVRAGATTVGTQVRERGEARPRLRRPTETHKPQRRQGVGAQDGVILRLALGAVHHLLSLATMLRKRIRRI